MDKNVYGIRAKRDPETDELYVNLEDLKETFQKEWCEVFHEKAEQNAGWTIVMTLQMIQHWFQPYKSTTSSEAEAALLSDLSQASKNP